MGDESKATEVIRALGVPDGAIQAFRQGLLSWYDNFGRDFPWRRSEANAFEKIVAEVLLQRTTATAVSRVFPDFIDYFSDWDAIRNAGQDELQRVLKPLGLWRRRATSLRALAEEMVDRSGEFPATRKELEKLPGVGQYIANAILLLCHDEPVPLLDVNMARVLERYFGPRERVDLRYDPYLQALAERVVPAERAPEFNFAVLDFGAAICKAQKPLCETCPLANSCLFFQSAKMT